MAVKDGQRWVTIKKEGPLHGRRILIDAKGFVVGGRVPKAFQGRHIGKLAGLSHKNDDETAKTPYDDYSHDELHEVHQEFKEHHEHLKKELAKDVHGLARSMRDSEHAGHEAHSLIREVKKRGGIKFDKDSDTAADYKGSVHPSVRRAVGSKNGMSLDQMADELGMSEDELKNQLSATKTGGGKSTVKDHIEAAKKQMGDEYASRLSAIKEMGEHVKAVGIAKRRKAAEMKKEVEGKALEDAKKGQAKDPSGEAYDSLKKNYPEDTLGWAKGEGKWSKQDGVNLKDIDMARRPGGRDMGKVNGIADAVKGGKKMDRVHLVKTPGGQKYKIADGYHRTLGHLKAGQDKIDAYVHNSDQDAGPWDKEMHDKKLNLSDAEKAKKESPEAAPQGDSGSTDAGQEAQVKRRGDKLDVLHDDVQDYMNGKADANHVLSKHHRLIAAMARNVAAKRGGEAEDLTQEGMTSAYKTLEALKNGTQKPKEGQHLGEHLLKRVKQGLSEGSRQQNERPMSRESSKLAALVNQHKQAHVNETGQEPSEDELFNRVSKDDKFNSAKFAAPGTKTSITDPREKFDALRDAMKNQKSQATLDEAQTDDEGGNMGTKGAQIASPTGNPEQEALRKEAEEEMQGRKDQLHQVLGEFGLSKNESHAVAHRFGVGHDDATGAVVPWDKVAEHMSKDLGKQVNPETARKHFNNGRAKLHQHIGDDRMSLLMQKSLMEDVGVHLLIKQLYELGLYDILKSHGLENEDVLEPVFMRSASAKSYVDLVKSLAPQEYAKAVKTYADGSVFAEVVEYRVNRG